MASYETWFCAIACAACYHGATATAATSWGHAAGCTAHDEGQCCALLPLWIKRNVHLHLCCLCVLCVCVCVLCCACVCLCMLAFCVLCIG